MFEIDSGIALLVFAGMWASYLQWQRVKADRALVLVLKKRAKQEKKHRQWCEAWLNEVNALTNSEPDETLN